MEKAIFLDRDGVINDLVYLNEEGIIDSPFTVKQFKLIPKVPEAIKKLHSLGFKMILISNQPGIAKGHFSEETFKKICKKMNDLLLTKNSLLDDEFYCLHHPNAKVKKYKKKCNCRKPKTGLIKKATKLHNLDLKNSYFIGDGIVDMKVAKNIGCKSVFIGNVNSKLTKILKDKKIQPDFIAHDLYEASIILSGKKFSNP